MPRSNNNVYRLLRIARDLSVKEVAEKLGVSSAHICAIEAGKKEPSLDKISEYAKVLGVDENTLFFFRKEENKPKRFETFLLAILNQIVSIDEKKHEDSDFES